MLCLCGVFHARSRRPVILKLKSSALVGGIESEDGSGESTAAFTVMFLWSRAGVAMGRLCTKWLIVKQCTTMKEMKRPTEYGLDVMSVLVQEGKGAKYCGGPVGIENTQTLYIEKAIC
jgi:hypothetical protein